MSGHLIGCAGDAQDLGKSHKLALVAFADSADDRTHIAFPGYEGVMKWASCSRSRAAELINDLEEAGYLQQHRSSRPGRRAEYIVFPQGCCDLHRTPDAEPRPSVEAVQAWARQAGVELTDDQAAAMAAQPADLANRSETSDLNGSETSDPSTPNRSEISDLSAQNGSEISVQVQNGSEKSDPFTTTTTNPPSPYEPRSCPTHGRDPISNCRGCGTTPRQREAAERVAAIAKKRAHDRAALAADRARRAEAGRAAQSEATRAALEAARAKIHAATPATTTSSPATAGSSR